MEEDLIFLETGRGPEVFRKWKRTSVFHEMEENFSFQNMEDSVML
jgi:hypothetical protein